MTVGNAAAALAVASGISFMTQGLRILIVEDLASDAELMVYELRQANLPFSTRRVEKDADFLREVAQFHPDLILSDYHLPTLMVWRPWPWPRSIALMCRLSSCPEPSAKKWPSTP